MAARFGKTELSARGPSFMSLVQRVIITGFGFIYHIYYPAAYKDFWSLRSSGMSNGVSFWEDGALSARTELHIST